MTVLKRKNIYFIGFLAVVGAILAYVFYLRGNGEPLYETYKVSYGNVSQGIAESGVVKPAKNLKLDFKTQGKVTTVRVRAGDGVAAGQELIVLDQQELRIQVLEAEAALDVAGAMLDKLLAGASREDIRVYETAVANAEVALKNKEQALADVVSDAENDLRQARENALVSLKNGYTKVDDAVRNKVDQFFNNPKSANAQLSFQIGDSQLKISIESGRIEMEDVLNSWKNFLDGLVLSGDIDFAVSLGKQNISRAKSFLDKASLAINNLNSSTELSQATIDAWKAAVSAARTNVDTAWSGLISEEQIIAAAKITNQTNINISQTAVDTANAGLKTAQDQLALKKAVPQDADVALAEAQVKQARAVLALNQERLNQTILKSPIDGTVSRIDIEIGETAKAGQPVVFIDSRGKFQIEADIYEEDIPKIRIGNSADIELIAFPGKVFKGSVIFIEPAEKIVGGVVYYEVNIGFEEEKEEIKTGMTADVVIKTASRENVLVIPQKMIQKKNGGTSVLVLKNGVTEERNIEIGIKGADDFVEVVSGLRGGEEIAVKK